MGQERVECYLRFIPSRYAPSIVGRIVTWMRRRLINFRFTGHTVRRVWDGWTADFG